MKENNKSFVFYKSFYEAISQIPPENQLEVYNAICKYSLEGKEPENLSGIASAIFILIKPNIDSSQNRYQASIENGKRGGRPRKNGKQEAEENQKETQQKPNKNQKETQVKPKQNLDYNVDVDKDEDLDVNKDYDEDVDVESLLQQRFVECTSSTNLNAISECISFLDDLPFEVIEMALVKTSEKNGRLEICKDNFKQLAKSWN